MTRSVSGDISTESGEASVIVPATNMHRLSTPASRQIQQSQGLCIFCTFTYLLYTERKRPPRLHSHPPYPHPDTAAAVTETAHSSTPKLRPLSPSTAPTPLGKSLSSQCTILLYTSLLDPCGKFGLLSPWKIEPPEQCYLARTMCSCVRVLRQTMKNFC